MKKIVSLSVFFIAGIAFAQAPKNTDIAAIYAATITVEDLKDDLTILASDALEGRETGKRGQKRADAYIRAHF